YTSARWIGGFTLRRASPDRENIVQRLSSGRCLFFEVRQLGDPKRLMRFRDPFAKPVVMHFDVTLGGCQRRMAQERLDQTDVASGLMCHCCKAVTQLMECHAVREDSRDQFSYPARRKMPVIIT